MRKKQGLKGAIFYNHFLPKNSSSAVARVPFYIVLLFWRNEFCQGKNVMSASTSYLRMGNEVPRFKDCKGVAQSTEQWTLTERGLGSNNALLMPLQAVG